MQAGGSGLPNPKHHDEGSLITLDIMLSQPGDCKPTDAAGCGDNDRAGSRRNGDFEGGWFQTLADNGTTVVRHQEFAQQGDAVVSAHIQNCGHDSSMSAVKPHIGICVTQVAPRCPSDQGYAAGVCRRVLGWSRQDLSTQVLRFDVPSWELWGHNSLDQAGR